MEGASGGQKEQTKSVWMNQITSLKHKYTDEQHVSEHRPCRRVLLPDSFCTLVRLSRGKPAQVPH